MSEQSNMMEYKPQKIHVQKGDEFINNPYQQKEQGFKANPNPNPQEPPVDKELERLKQNKALLDQFEYDLDEEHWVGKDAHGDLVIYSESQYSSLKQNIEKKLLEKQWESVPKEIETPYDKFEYDDDTDTWFLHSEDGNFLSYTDAEYQEKKKAFIEDEQQKRQEAQKKKEVEKANAQLNKTAEQQQLNESLKKEVKEANVKMENIQAPSGEVQKEPELTEWEENFSKFQSKDSLKMLEVRRSWKHYNSVKGTVNEVLALNDLIQACNNYCFLKISFFKRGEAKKRLEQVKLIRDRAKNALAISPYKDKLDQMVEIRKGDRKLEEERRKEKKIQQKQEDQEGEPTYIYTNADLNYSEMIPLSKKLTIGALGGLAWLVGSTVSLVAAPFKFVAGVGRKLYRHSMEKKYGIKYDTSSFAGFADSFKPKPYINRALVLFVNPIHIESSSKKKLAKERYEAEHELINQDLESYREKTYSDEDIDKDIVQDDAYESRNAYMECKAKLKELSSKKTSNMTSGQLQEHNDEIERLSKEVEEHQENVFRFAVMLKENGETINNDMYGELLEDRRERVEKAAKEAIKNYDQKKAQDEKDLKALQDTDTSGMSDLQREEHQKRITEIQLGMDLREDAIKDYIEQCKYDGKTVDMSVFGKALKDIYG